MPSWKKELDVDVVDQTELDELDDKVVVEADDVEKLGNSLAPREFSSAWTES